VSSAPLPTMEPAGLAIGVLGLAGIFKTVLEAWEFVDAARAHTENFSYFRTRLDTQRALFLIWAQKLGFFSPEGYNKALDLPQQRMRQLSDTLTHIFRLFSDTDQLLQTYGFKLQPTAENPYDISENESLGEPKDEKSSIAIFHRMYARLRSGAGTDRHTAVRRIAKLRAVFRPSQKSLHIWKTTRWSIRDEKKSAVLLARVEALVEDLDKLTRDIEVTTTTEELAAEAVADVSEASLAAIEEASRDNATVISSAASIRLRRLEAQTISTANQTFATAMTHLSINVTKEPESATAGPHEAHSRKSNTPVDFQALVEANRGACASAASVAEALVAEALLTRRFSWATRVAKEMLDETRQRERNGWYTFAPIVDSAMDKFLGTIRGPPDTPYQGGIFHIRINITDKYPFIPPQVWFLTRILHPNVDAHGAICLDILGKTWSVGYTMRTLLLSIASLLDDPNWDEPVGGTLHAEWTNDREECERRSRDWTRKYATGQIIHPEERQDGFYTVGERPATQTSDHNRDEIT